MEFPDLGKHCSVSSCKRLDFLPYTCDRCKSVHCEEHRSYTDHKCPVDVDRRVPVCPICRQIIEVLPSENVDRKINRHIEAGCPKSEGLKTAKFPCSHPRCPNVELQKILCPFCTHQFCIRHKQPGDHSCEKNPHKAATETAPQTATQWQVWGVRFIPSLSQISGNRSSQTGKSISTQISAAQLSSDQKITEGASKLAETLAAHAAKHKDSEKARKVALLKNKNNAQGPSNLAPDKRFYLEVVYPMDSKIDPKWFFFPEDRKYGVVLDEVASAGKVKNQNHLPNSPKLQLFALKTGEPIPLSKSLKDLKSVVSSSDPILLEFVDVMRSPSSERKED